MKRILTTLKTLSLMLVISLILGGCVQDNDTFEPKGTYNKAGFDESYVQYEFEGLDMVLYEFSGMFLMGEKTDDQKASSCFNLLLDTETWKDPKVKAISNNYIIFSVKIFSEGSDEREDVAVEIAITPANFGDYQIHRCLKLEEIPKAEKIYPLKKSEVVQNPYYEGG